MSAKASDRTERDIVRWVGAAKRMAPQARWGKSARARTHPPRPRGGEPLPVNVRVGEADAKAVPDRRDLDVAAAARQALHEPLERDVTQVAAPQLRHARLRCLHVRRSEGLRPALGQNEHFVGDAALERGNRVDPASHVVWIRATQRRRVTVFAHQRRLRGRAGVLRQADIQELNSRPSSETALEARSDYSVLDIAPLEHTRTPPRRTVRKARRIPQSRAHGSSDHRGSILWRSRRRQLQAARTPERSRRRGSSTLRPR